MIALNITALGKIDDVYYSFKMLLVRRQLINKVTVASLAHLVYFKMFSSNNGEMFSNDNPGLTKEELSQLALAIIEAECILKNYKISKVLSKKYLVKLQEYKEIDLEC